jgi:hypothetical protein
MSDIDRYLDELFDRLAGTGSAGRRALAETEDHLRASVAAGMAEGNTEQQAEREAVARFGSAAQLAAQLRRAYGPAPGGALLSWVSLFAGLGIATLGVSHLGYAANIRLMLRMHPEPIPACAGLLPTPVSDCSTSVEAMYAAAGRGGELLAVAVAILLGRRLAMARYHWLVPVSGRLAMVLAALFALAGAALFASQPMLSDVDTLLGAQPGPGLRIYVITSGTAIFVAVALLLGALVRARSATSRRHAGSH